MTSCPVRPVLCLVGLLLICTSRVEGQTTVFADDFAGGFDPLDSTAALQGAIDSGADRVIVRNMGADWVIHQRVVTRSNLEIMFAPGVVVSAGSGLGEENLFIVNDVANVSLRGYGATFRGAPDGVHVLAINGGANIQVLGLTLENAGYDGLYVSDGNTVDYSSNVLVKDVISQNNRRQGLSVVSVDGLVVVDSEFRNTAGRNPQAGIDIEPNVTSMRMSGIEIRNVIVDNNAGDGLQIVPERLSADSADISVLVDGLEIRSSGNRGVRIHNQHDDTPDGLITIRNVTIDDVPKTAIQMFDQSSQDYRVRFEHVTLNHVPLRSSYRPISVDPDPGVASPGGIDFANVQINDFLIREAIVVGQDIQLNQGLHDVHGTIFVDNPGGTAPLDIGTNLDNVDLQVVAGTAPAAPPDVILDFNVDPVAQTWQMFADVDADTDGLASFIIDVQGSHGVTVTESQLEVNPTFWSFGRSDGVNGVGISASQETFTGDINDLQLSEGIGTPLLLASGTYSGTMGFLKAEVQPGGFFNVLPDGFVAGGATQAGHVIPDYEVDTLVFLPPGDFNYDGVLDDADIDMLRGAINASSSDPSFDLDGNTVLNAADFDYMIQVILATAFGDATLDKSVNEGDLSLVRSNFGLGQGWAGGNFDLNGIVDADDLALMRTNFESVSASGAAITVPEPVVFSGLGLMLPALLHRAFRHQK